MSDPSFASYSLRDPFSHGCRLGETGHIWSSCSESNNFVCITYLQYSRRYRDRNTPFFPKSEWMLHLVSGNDQCSAIDNSSANPGEMQNGEVPEEGPIIPSGVCYIYDTRMMQHGCISDFHPEQPLRIASIFARLQEAECINRMVHIPCREALKEEVTLVHTEKLWDTVEEFQSACSYVFLFVFIVICFQSCRMMRS